MAESKNSSLTEEMVGYEKIIKGAGSERPQAGFDALEFSDHPFNDPSINFVLDMHISERTNYLTFISLFVAVILFAGCGSDSEYPIRSEVEGTLRILAAIDSTGDFSGFRISVLTQKDGDVDTLGTAVTERDGVFSMTVRAPEKGIYPILVERGGTTLSIGEFVAVDGDSVSISATFPLGTRPLPILSEENAAWTAYKNTKAQHNRSMLDLLESDSYRPQGLGLITAQTSTILWSIQSSYAGTMGGDLAMAESIVMMEGWNDSTVVARLAQVSLDNESIVEVVRAARRSVARLSGGKASIDFIRDYLARVPESKQAGIMAELVVAFADSGMTVEAVAASTDLRRLYPDSEWFDWAARATYDLENLQPGMDAPVYSVTSREGVELSSSSMSGKFVVLEFFNPLEQIWRRELQARDGIAGALTQSAFETISVSVEPDSVINEALFDGDDHPGHFIWSDLGLDHQIVKDYNVNVLPTRFLINPDGIIVARYTGPALANLERDLATIIADLNDIAARLSQ